jgi:hypothetical protein
LLEQQFCLRLSIVNQAPPGWHTDPDDSSQLRYWDGIQWTEHRHPVQPPTQQLEQRERAQQPVKAPLGGGTLPTLWEAWGKPLSGIGGGRYRLTAHYLYFERGTLKTDSQQVPVSALHDIDVRQTMSQKARNVGTIVVHINRGNRMEIVQLVDIPNFREGQAAINDAAHTARAILQQRQNTSTVRYEGTHPVAASIQSAAAAGADQPTAPDYIEQLEQLAKLRDNGILSEEEFSMKKADILRRM